MSIVLTPPASSSSSSGGSGGFAVPSNIPIAGRWYTSHNGLEAGVQVSMGADVLHVMPLVFPSTVTLDRISIDCSVTNSANARLGLYSNAASGLARPGELLVETSSFALSVTTGDNDQTISQELTGGVLYWAVINLSVAATLQSYGGADSGLAFGMTAGDGAINTQSRRAEIAHTFGALPADSSGSALTIGSNSYPLISVRVAS